MLIFWPGAGCIAEQPARGGGVDHGDETSVGVVVRIRQASRQQLEVEDAPVVGVDAPHLQLADAVALVDRHRSGRGEGRHALHAGHRLEVFVDGLVAEQGGAHGVVVGAFAAHAIHLQEAFALAFHAARPEGGFQQGGDHHQHHQGEHDADQVDRREQLAAHEDLPGGQQVVTQHGPAPGGQRKG
jgi:hypothetical protein